MVNIKPVVCGDIATNCYIVSNEIKKCFLIDPGAEGEKIAKIIDRNGLEPLFILNTHGHYDHIGADKFLAEKYKIPVFVHEKDYELLLDADKNFSSYFNNSIVFEDAKTFNEGFEFEFDKQKWKVMHTPGHTMGSVVFFNEDEKLLFTGDTLFSEGWGRTDLYGGDEEALKDSLSKLLFFDREYRCYPGHGDTFVLGEQVSVLKYFLNK